MSTVTFTEAASKRIAAVVRKVERTAAPRRDERSSTLDNSGEFWALILGSDISGRYAFQPVRPDPISLDATAVIIISDRGDEMRWVFTESDAFIDSGREANGNVNVPRYSIVKMSFAGYDRNSDPAFVFFWPKIDLEGGLPPHDHRDNLNGGFAFGTFHPGTSIPQLPYPI